MLSSFEQEIKVLNEFLNDMPKNNTKNQTAYEKQLEASIKKYKATRQFLVNEIDRRFQKYERVKINAIINELHEKISSYTKDLKIVDALNTAYEKSDLDNILYRLNHFYQADLEKINNDILQALDKFREVGIILKPEEFDYSLYAAEYMKNYIGQDTEITVENVKPIFEKLYWKCPNIIKHIDLSFRKLYLKNYKKFNDYFERKKTSIINNDSSTSTMNKIGELIIEKDKLETSDLRMIYDKFIDGTLDIKSYQPSKTLQLYENFIISKKDNVKDYITFNKDLRNLIRSLQEYSNYNKYLFVVEDIKTIYTDKDKYKGSCKKILKDVSKLEKNLSKYNKKLAKFLKNGNNDENINININSIVTEIDALYEEYEKNYFYEKIANLINDSSTIYDILSLANSYDVYLTECIKKNNKDITDIDIEEMIGGLKDFLKSPYNTIIDNMGINDTLDVPRIIYDHYKLLNINIEAASINENDIPGIIKNINILLDNEVLLNNNLKYEDILYMIESKKIVENEEERI